MKYLLVTENTRASAATAMAASSRRETAGEARGHAGLARLLKTSRVSKRHRRYLSVTRSAAGRGNNRANATLSAHFARRKAARR